MATTEYDKIYYDATKPTEAENVYDLLLNREKDTLQTVNRVVNQIEYEKTTKPFRKSAIDNIVYKVFTTINSVISDLSSGKPISRVFRHERRLYIGLFCISVSILLIILCID
jgi:hypothetical protein